MPMKTGLASVSFRKSSIEEIVDLVAQAGLDGIEWGGDVHVPHGDLDRAATARRQCQEAGVAVSSYGSYFRLGQPNDFTFDAVVETALALGTTQIRVWPGNKGSADATDEYREEVASHAREVADKAADAGLQVSLEFHGNSLTDTAESASRLLEAVPNANFHTYWQPAGGLTDDERLAGLRLVLPRVSNLHVFWWTDGQRLPLAEGRESWAKVFELFAGSDTERFAMLEFVSDDSPASFLRDAATLRQLAASE